MKKLISLVVIAILIINILSISIFAVQQNNPEQKKETEIFYDDFSSNKLDTSKWLIAEKAWGGNNGGVVAENVSISDGKLKLEGHGDNYTGNVAGIKKPDGKRTGAAIATKEYFGSGSYEVVAKVAPELGACSAIWTFEYEEYYPGDAKYEELAPNGASYYVVNHEIDIEMPGRPASKNENISYEYALCNTWVGEKGSEHTTNYTKLPSAQNDGNFHTYRFDWHTGDENETKRVEFYIDGELVCTSTTHIPTNKGRLWIGLWFPNGWAGTPDFDTTVFEIDSVKITPFNEAGDTEANETYPDHGWHVEENSTEPLEFTMALKQDKNTLYAGDTFTLTAKIDKLQKNSANGLMAISGKLEYDKSVLELDLDSIKGIGNWSMSRNYFNETNGKFILDSGKYADKAQDVLEMKFKIKENTTKKETIIKVKDILGATGQNQIGIIKSADKQINIKIDKKQEDIPDSITSEIYNIEDKYISKILPDTKVSEFKANTTYHGDLVFTDAKGKTLKDTDIIKTGTKLKVGTTLNYELIVIGDIDGDGRITVNDIGKLKLHYIDLSPLNGIYLKSADMDDDNKITINDIAILKLIYIEEIKLR